MSHRRIPRPPLATTLGLVLVAALAVGCSEDAPSVTDDDADPAASAPSTPDGSSAPTESGEPSQPTEPIGATGPRLVLGPLSLRAPAGWTKVPSDTPFDASAQGGSGVQGNQVVLVTFPVVGGGTTVEENARVAVDGSRPKADILDAVVVGGVEMAHVRGFYGGVLTDLYVADVGGDQVTINFGYDNGVEDDPDFQQALMDEVLATAEWSG